jgi:hypothetical protein
MSPDTSIPSASQPDAAEVEALGEVWDKCRTASAAAYRAYSTAKAAHEAANDTGRILDEALAARQDALDAYSVAWATHNRANNAVAEACVARDHAGVASSAARTAYSAALAAAVAARKAHEATR